jgi:hypothetical protein
VINRPQRTRVGEVASIILVLILLQKHMLLKPKKEYPVPANRFEIIQKKPNQYVRNKVKD